VGVIDGCVGRDRLTEGTRPRTGPRTGAAFARRVHSPALSLLAWLIVSPILGVWSARHGDTRELLAGCLGAVVAAAGTWTMAALATTDVKGDPLVGLVPVVLFPAGWVGLLFLVPGGINLLRVQDGR